MSAAPLELPHPMPSRPFTVAEYAALGETESGYTELIEGRLLMSPSPVPDYGYAMGELFVAVRSSLPEGFEAIQDTDLDLELAPADEPGTVHRPDVMVVAAQARRRVRAEGGLLRASDARLVVEIVSPSSRRTDRVVKRDEYATAGIPHYWIVDLSEPVSVLVCHLAGELGYANDHEFTDVLSVAKPFPIQLELSRLV
jgi:Uma2 family endonuclease